MQIKDIITRAVKTKFGEKPVYTAIDTYDVAYEMGFKKPAFKVGDEVEFTFTETKYGKQVDLDSVRVVRSGTGSGVTSAPPAAPVKPAYTPAVSRQFPVPPLHPDRSIVRQNALQHAGRIVAAFINNTKVVNGDEAVTLDEAVEWTILAARQFEAYSCGDAELQAAMEGEDASS